MDVDSLRAELEKHLAKNPDEHAPHGFRARFNTVVEQYQAEDVTIPKPVLEQELQQIRNEAEAANKAAGTEPADDPAPGPAPRAEAPHEPEPPAPAEAVESPPVSAPAPAPADPAPSGAMPFTLIALVIAVIVLAAAWYFFRR